MLPIFNISLIGRVDALGGNGAKAFTRVCLCIVCPHDRIKTAETTIAELATGIVLATRLILGQKFKGQGHRIIKYKSVFQGIEWPV